MSRSFTKFSTIVLCIIGLAWLFLAGPGIVPSAITLLLVAQGVLLVADVKWPKEGKEGYRRNA